MYLKTLFVRFYKSFNEDFTRKIDNEVKPKPWEMIDGIFYPYIEVPIENKITTIVGDNESGKSHLLSAIEKAISGKGIERSDFCRYSPFFTVKRNELKYSDFGTEWSGFSDDEKEALRKIIGIDERVLLDKIFVFRQNVDDLTVYLPNQKEYITYKIDEKQASSLQDLLPQILKIESNVALPSSVPIRKLVEMGREDYFDDRKFELLDQKHRNEIIDKLDIFSDNPRLIGTSSDFFGNNDRESLDRETAKSIRAIMAAIDEASFSGDEKEKREKEFDLSYKLICKIAQVDINALVELADAIRDGMQGYANGIIEKINRQLSINFNFPNYWVQDPNFRLKVMARDYDLVFTISDRTGTEYSFEERSQGLRYFLSYYIQYRSHEPALNKSEILLMDEPDAYLSSQAQQDLLKVFDLFANPEKGSHITQQIQVVYVTHSPFLIDKNHAERIRVLKKGEEGEGTQVVKSAAQNHYEPLRSSIGAYVGETFFIGNCNLMVEGITDQILIAGATTYLRKIGTSNLETLDLNQITIAQSGSASHIPYLVYLARGRDIKQPAVIVLLDSDDSGNEAKKQLLGRGGEHRRPLLKEQFILQIGDLREKLSLIDKNVTVKIDMEDIIPLPICIQAINLYLQEFLQLSETRFTFLTEDLILSKITGENILKAIQLTLLEYPEMNLKISKVGFARNIIQVVNEWSLRKDLSESQSIALDAFNQNFKALFKKLNAMQRNAQQILKDKKLTQRIDRIKREFEGNHPIAARREQGVILLDEIQNVLENNSQNESVKEIEAVQKAIQNLRLVHKLNIDIDGDMDKSIEDYPGFLKGLEQIKYAGLLASQERIIDELSLEDISEETQTNELSVVDEQDNTKLAKNTNSPKSKQQKPDTSN